VELLHQGQDPFAGLSVTRVDHIGALLFELGQLGADPLVGLDVPGAGDAFTGELLGGSQINDREGRKVGLLVKQPVIARRFDGDRSVYGLGLGLARAWAGDTLVAASSTTTASPASSNE
jgi:hypothetical protein